jgi:hypothetical protein
MAIHRFIGDRHAPTTLASVRTRRAVLGSGEIPEVLRTMAAMRILYSEADSNKKPHVLIDSVDSPGHHLWKISVPVGEQLRGVRAGLTLERHPSTKFLEGPAPAAITNRSSQHQYEPRGSIADINRTRSDSSSIGALLGVQPGDVLAPLEHLCPSFYANHSSLVQRCGNYLCAIAVNLVSGLSAGDTRSPTFRSSAK